MAKFIMLILMILLLAIIFLMIISIYSHGFIKKTNSKSNKLAKLDLNIEECKIVSISPALTGQAVTISDKSGKRMKFLVEAKENSGYRVGQFINILYTENGPRIIKEDFANRDYLFQLK